MIKMFGAMNRLDGMTREAFADYYQNQHVKVGGTMAGVVRYVSGVALQGANGGDPPFDAVSEHWWESTEAVRAAYTSELWEKARHDHPSVVNGRLMFLAEEHIVMPPPAGYNTVKYLAFLTRKDCQTPEEFRAYWFDKHMPLALKTPALLGYKACPTTFSVNGDSILRKDPEPAQFDGVVEMFFANLDSFRKSYTDPHWDSLRKDYYANFAMGRIQLLVQPRLVLDKTTSS
jgi:uncharacterized protein (TIGR02118 family)